MLTFSVAFAARYVARIWERGSERGSKLKFNTVRLVPDDYWQSLGLDPPAADTPPARELAIRWATLLSLQLERELAGRRGVQTSTTTPAGMEISLEETIEWYVAKNPNDGAPLTLAKYRDCGKRLVAFFGPHRRLSTLTKQDATDYRNAGQLRGLRNRTIKNDLVFLKQISVESYGNRASTGMHQIGLLKLPTIKRQKSQRQPLSIDELRAIRRVKLERDGDRVVRMILAAAVTGLRKTALLHLEEKWIDRTKREIRIPGRAMKGGENRWGDDDFVVPLCRWALELIPVPPKGTRWNFASRRTGKPNGQVDRSLWRIAELAGIRYFSLQELRQTFLTLLDENGVEEPIREELVGHAPRSVSEISYIRRRPQVLRDAVELFDTAVRPRIESEGGTVVKIRA
ncbi:MAG TPA: tyrosine-type recombinase/integrase [Thermoanaerobaculia bacterium]|jgi:integrase|nr:tyrosine-type recombinase/integrase [Thermoanaerobaculia bacterium]